MHILTVDIEVYNRGGLGENRAQARYLVHGHDDVAWTDSIDEAMGFLKHSLERFEEEELIEMAKKGYTTDTTFNAGGQK